MLVFTPSHTLSNNHWLTKGVNDSHCGGWWGAPRAGAHENDKGWVTDSVPYGHAKESSKVHKASGAPILSPILQYSSPSVL